VSVSLELFGDHWSLLIIRDLMVRGYRTFREFQQAGKGSPPISCLPAAQAEDGAS